MKLQFSILYTNKMTEMKRGAWVTFYDSAMGPTEAIHYAF